MSVVRVISGGRSVARTSDRVGNENVVQRGAARRARAHQHAFTREDARWPNTFILFDAERDVGCLFRSNSSLFDV